MTELGTALALAVLFLVIIAMMAFVGAWIHFTPLPVDEPWSRAQRLRVTVFVLLFVAAALLIPFLWRAFESGTKAP